MGPIFELDTFGTFAQLIASDPSGLQLATMQSVVALPGAAATNAGDEIVAVLGVGGSPGGNKGEVCARADVARIRDRLTR